MGARGPAPTSKKTLAKRGSWRAKDRADDLELEDRAPDPPASLDREAKAEWKRVVKILGAKHVLTPADRGAMTLLCELWSEDRDLHRRLKKPGVVVGSTDWKRVVTQRNEVRKQLVQLYQRFGMTPADRTRVKVPEKGKSADDKGRFFDRGKSVIGRVGA